MYEERKYRGWVKHRDLVPFNVMVEETDLMILCDTDLSVKATEFIKKHRKQIKDYIFHHKGFAESLKPLKISHNAPQIVKDMAKASSSADVGPMASVAGVMAEYVGKDLLNLSSQVIVENGGDIFIKSDKERLMGIYAGKSPFTGKLDMKIKPEQTPLGICTSSGTVGHSLSYGKADAVITISKTTALADAVATAAGNVVKSAHDIQKGVDFARNIDGIDGVVVIVGDKIGAWGNVELTGK
ncbi:UPF0280 family protein [Candidatus Poribacteria bacterium]|nr:UPF0280 family protein [Candidatus Poribacteria bacterium]